jgi:hypothetical protein
MLLELDIWQSAAAMIKSYGSDAAREAANRARELMDRGDNNGAINWHRIGLLVQRLQTLEPGVGEKQH